MKIRLIRDVPVDRRHGLTKGRILDVIRPVAGKGGIGGLGRADPMWWVLGDAGEEVAIFGYEAEPCPAAEAKPEAGPCS